VSLMSVAAAAGAGVATWLLLSPTPTGRPTRLLRTVVGPTGGVGMTPAIVVAVLLGALIVNVEGTVLALGVVAVGAAAGAWRMTARGRERRVAQERADRVVEVCEALAGELRAGQPPLRALRHCVEVWSELEPVATAGELGADVPRALRKLASLPGASGLAEVASAWQVSHGSGGTMALALGRVAESSRRSRAAQRLVASELASAQATARLVAVLPVAVLAMGSGLGGDPWAFLLNTPVGLGCLALGLVLAYTGLTWIERIAVTAVDP
jgi:tight adherence protein B